MPYTQFWESEPREIILAIRGWMKDREDESRFRLEQNRIMTFYNIIPHIKQGSIKKPSDLYRLPWDPDEHVRVTPEEFKKLTQSWDDELKGPDGKFR